MSTEALVPTTFPTLRSAGYIKCEHPRTARINGVQQCCDCGALRHGEHWVGGHLEFKRLPHKVS